MLIKETHPVKAERETGVLIQGAGSSWACPAMRGIRQATSWLQIFAWQETLGYASWRSDDLTVVTLNAPGGTGLWRPQQERLDCEIFVHCQERGEKTMRNMPAQ